MPELPEMENYKSLLNTAIVGQTITQIQINRPKSLNVTPEHFSNYVLAQKVVRIDRRAKQLLFYLENGSLLLLHLMLGGWIYYGSQEEKPQRTVQIQLSFGSQQLYFIGLRLGYLHLYLSEAEVLEQLNKLGPEPLHIDFTLSSFELIMKEKGGRLKSALVDQGFLSGIGNCYADEICFHAAILPTRSIDSLTHAEIVQLYQSIRYILQRALSLGGYMEHPFFHGDSITGGYNEHCLVYDREGERCVRCEAVIVKQSLSSRKMFFCSNCQK